MAELISFAGKNKRIVLTGTRQECEDEWGRIAGEMSEWGQSADYFYIRQTKEVKS